MLCLKLDFKENLEHGPINMTDVYNVMVHVLQLEGHPNNGTWDQVKQMLKNEGSNSLSMLFMYIILLLTTLIFFNFY